jgi:predicted nucleic acid-binding protein
MTAFFDTCIVISLLNASETFHAWSTEQLLYFKNEGPVLISDIVYSELAAGMSSKSDLDNALQPFGFERATRNDAALFAAGQAFKDYKDRRRKETKPKGTSQAAEPTNVLPDFFIGALASELDVPLVTSNPKDFRSYFNSLSIIEPPRS